MKSILKKTLKFFVLIIAILFFLQSILVIYLSGKLRESDRIRVTDDNRSNISFLMEETIDSLIESWGGLLTREDYQIPDMNRAKEIDCSPGWHDYEITIYYEDGTKYRLMTRGGEPLILHIQNEGYKYNAYFRSIEFVVDLIKLVASFVILVVVAIKVLDL